MKQKSKKSIYGYSMTIPAVVIYTVMFIIPVIIGVFTAFTDWNIKNLFDLQFNGLENFKLIFHDQYFILAITNTLIFALVTTVFKVLLGLLLAVALVKPLKSRNLLRAVFYIPAVLSSVVIGLIFTSFFQMDGMFDRILQLFGYTGDFIWLGDERTALWCTIGVEIWQWVGYTMTLFIAGLQAISQEYYEAAKIDGASGMQVFRAITLPLLAPSFTVTITTALIGGLKVFSNIFILTNGGPGFATQVLGTYVYRSFSAGFLGKSSAMSLVLTIIVCVFTIGLNKYLTSKEVEA